LDFKTVKKLGERKNRTLKWVTSLKEIV